MSGSYDVCGVEAEAMCIVENVHFDPESSLYPRSPTRLRAVKSCLVTATDSCNLDIARNGRMINIPN